jgi:hypothetical protein
MSTDYILRIGTYTLFKFGQSRCQSKHTPLKKGKNSIANIFVIFHFKEKQKKWNSVFVILLIPCKLQQKWLKKWLLALMG